MGLTYFKRYRMEIQLSKAEVVLPQLPSQYEFIAWDESVLEAHAHCKYLSFRDEIDADVFPCFNSFDGCHRLMSEINRKEGFLSEATWLIAYTPEDQHKPQFCGTIQGIRDRSGQGAIQNIGVTTDHRSRGLGTLLIYQALAGFQRVGLQQVYLEVTAQNEGAITLYERLGFVKTKTVYKSVEMAYS